MRKVFTSKVLAIRGLMAAAAMMMVGWMGTAAEAQTVCARCGKIHSVPVTMSPSSGVTQPIQTVNYASNYASPVGSGPVARSSSAAVGGVSNVLSALNGQRARQGIGTLASDPTLQAVAQRRAQMMASMRLKSHPPGSYAPGRYEGVGWSSSYSPGAVMACYTSDPSMRAAGAAMATGPDGVYFAVVYR